MRNIYRKRESERERELGEKERERERGVVGENERKKIERKAYELTSFYFFFKQEPTPLFSNYP